MSETQEELATRAHAAMHAETRRYMEAAQANPEAFARATNSAQPPEREEPFNRDEAYGQLARINSTMSRLTLKNQAPRPAGPPPSPLPPPPAARADLAPPPIAHHYAPPAPAAPLPAPPVTPSALASRDYANLTNYERVTLAQEDPESFARNRANWESRGCPPASGSTPRADASGAPPVDAGYEHWSNRQRALIASRDPERFDRARNDWIKRGAPIEDEVA